MHFFKAQKASTILKNILNIEEIISRIENLQNECEYDFLYVRTHTGECIKITDTPLKNNILNEMRDYFNRELSDLKAQLEIL